jgi:CTD small phosphatase-like protein 2
LEAANEDFEVIVFTASHSCYADVVLDHLDPTGKLIHHRFYREHCIMVDGIFVKDLRVLSNRRLQDMVIVDNAAYSYGYQLENGIPIISWYDDRYDRELCNLIDYMKVLATCEDVRVVNNTTFHLSSFYEDYMHEYLSDHQRTAYSPRSHLTEAKRTRGHHPA